MKIAGLFLIVGLAWLGACSNNVAKQNAGAKTIDTLSYIYKTIYADNGSYSVRRPYVKIRYPLFKSKNLNDTMAKHIVKLFYSDPTPYNLSALTHDYIEGYKNTPDKIKKTLHYYLNISAKVIRQDSSRLTIEMIGSDSSKRLSAIKYINWNFKSQRTISSIH